MAASGTDKKYTVATITADPVFIAGLVTGGLVPAAGGVILTDAAQTITTATITDVTWGTEVSDPDGWTAGGIASLTVPAGKGGRYMITYTGAWSGAVGTTPGAAFYLNAVYQFDVPVSLGGFPGLTHVLSFVRTLVAGDTFRFSVFHNAGVNRDITSRLEVCPV